MEKEEAGKKQRKGKDITELIIAIKSGFTSTFTVVSEVRAWSGDEAMRHTLRKGLIDLDLSD